MRRLVQPPKYGRQRIDMHGGMSRTSPNRIGLGRLVGPENPDGKFAQDIGARIKRGRR